MSDGLLTRDQILAAEDLRYDVLDVPEWGGKVRLKAMTGAERDAFEAAVLTGKGRDRDINLTNLRAKLVARCLVDADGKRLFSDQEVALLGNKSAAALQRVFDRCAAMNALTPEAVEELAKNSASAQDADSTFD